jgi:hypothetical protein
MGLYLLDHGSHLAKGDLDATATTARARLDSVFLAAFTFAVLTYDVSGERELGRLAFVEFFQCGLNTMHDVFGLARTLAATTAEER